jgi:metal-responsive CopG/Arc/MetJ family transcriptional regulator
MKTAISLPEQLFRRVEQHAHRLKMSRSEFFARAAERLADELDDERLTEAIDVALSGTAPDENDEFMSTAARRVLGSDKPAR